MFGKLFLQDGSCKQPGRPAPAYILTEFVEDALTKPFQAAAIAVQWPSTSCPFAAAVAGKDTWYLWTMVMGEQLHLHPVHGRAKTIHA